MSGDGLAAQDAEIVQALDDSLSVLPLAVSHISLSLRNVNMEAGIELLRKPGAVRHGLVAHGEGGVQAEEASEQTVSGLFTVCEEGLVFRDAWIRNFSAVAIRDLVAETTAHAGAAHGLRNAEKAAGDRAGTGM